MRDKLSVSMSARIMVNSVNLLSGVVRREKVYSNKGILSTASHSHLSELE